MQRRVRRKNRVDVHKLQGRQPKSKTAQGHAHNSSPLPKIKSIPTSFFIQEPPQKLFSLLLVKLNTTFMASCSITELSAFIKREPANRVSRSTITSNHISLVHTNENWLRVLTESCSGRITSSFMDYTHLHRDDLCSFEKKEKLGKETEREHMELWKIEFISISLCMIQNSTCINIVCVIRLDSTRLQSQLQKQSINLHIYEQITKQKLKQEKKKRTNLYT